MANRPSTAASAISSAISEDEDESTTTTGLPTIRGSTPQPQVLQGYTHVRGEPSLNSATATNLIADAPSSNAGSSRPQSPVSSTSRTHVPSLTAHGFFRPMSSQRLQAQRLGYTHTPVARPVQHTPVASRVVEQDDVDTRHSISTIQTTYAPLVEDELATHSRGTEYTQSVAPDPMSKFQGVPPMTISGGGTRMLLSQANSAQPSSLQAKGQHLTLGNGFTNGVDQDPLELKSPRSFRSQFSLGSKRHRGETGHEHLSSQVSSPRFDTRKIPPSPKAAKQIAALGKNHQYFQGNTVFWAGGRLQNARDRPINIATGVFLVLPAILFFAFPTPWLWHHASPAVPIIFAYILFICLSSFIHASVIDPGIFPRNIQPFPPAGDNEDPLAIGPPMNDWVMVRLATSETAAMDVPVKFCKTCNIWRPPRCYHCRVCDNCVETLDHHCVWLNNCVGRRNYRYFFSFVSSGTLLGIYLTFASLGQCIGYHSQNHTTFGQAINHNRVSFAMFIYGLLATPYPASLWFYHMFLMGRGETTREYLTSRKFAKVDRHRPFTQGNVVRNWIAVLLRPKGPTYLHFKRDYEAGDQRFGLKRGRQEAPQVEEAKGGAVEMKPVYGAPKSFEGPNSRSIEQTELPKGPI